MSLVSNSQSVSDTHISSPILLKESAPTPQHTKAMIIATRLQEAGFSAYFAGGWVRDIYAGKENDDIDIVTNASAKSIQKLFPKTSDEGLDYGVVFVDQDGEMFEVATFRKDGQYTNGRSPNSVASGTMRDDALRRDFTVNALYYDPIKQEVYDYTEGRSDIDSRIIRAIGDPLTRFGEDRLRILRAIRFSTKLEFDIEDNTMEAIRELAPTIFPSLSKEKVWKELKKMSYYPNFADGIVKMYDTGVLQHLFPTLKDISKAEVLKSALKIRALPRNAPTLVKILQLFPDISRAEALKLCRYLKLSTREGAQVVNDYDRVRKLLERAETATDYDWTVAYAKNRAELFIPPNEENSQRVLRLAPHIERAKQRKTIVTGEYLKKLGLDPNVLKRDFGKLLVEAEKIAVNRNFSTPENVLPELKKSKLWPSSILV